jgi:pimeloyl-ACP methyl ester carboxylesterase
VSSSLSDVDQDALVHLRSAAERAALRPARFVLPGVRDVIANGIRLQLLDWGPVDARSGVSRPEQVRAHQDRLWASVSQIHCPTLVLRGERSTVFLDEDAAELAAALADARVTVVPDAGHTVQGDNPRGLLDAVVPFLAKIHGPLVSGY